MGSMRFRFDGQPINETDTPAQVGKSLQYSMTTEINLLGLQYKLEFVHSMHFND